MNFPADLPGLRQQMAARFSLHHDLADPDVIDDNLRSGVELRGATVWILMFAIFIASIGLNVNSTAVIIGAMLVSPLMGPIMGIGYGVGIYDFALIRKSLFNLGIATVISLLTSTLYFTLSPLSDAQSELLARTTPTIWDVLIALFGGLAGIVGATRREKSNVIPGVAIATALMPPLCTAGYGLASGNWGFFFGAFYLFAINGVFIAFATVVIISLLRLPHRQYVDKKVEARLKGVLYAVILLTATPSIYLAWQLVGNEIYQSQARQFARRELNLPQTHVAELQIVAAEKKIEATLIGEPLTPATLAAIEARLKASDLHGSRLIVHQASGNQIDVGALKAGIASELYRFSQANLLAKEEEIAQLKERLAQIGRIRSQAGDIARELSAQYPQLADIVIGEGAQTGDKEPSGSAPGAVLLLSATSGSPLAAADRERIRLWFATRTKSASVKIFLDAPLPAAPVDAPATVRSGNRTRKKP